MSRTDKTQPYPVRLWDGTLHRVAVHNHVDGICDLPQSLDEELAQYAANGGYLDRAACHWEFQYTGINTCCCNLCRDPARRRAERRADRHRVRRDLREMVKQARTRTDDIE